MAEAGDREDRTEAATPRRLQRAREQGHLPLSRELASLGGLAGAVAALAVAGPDAARRAAAGLGLFLARAHDWDLSAGPGAAFREAAIAGVRLAGPVVLPALVSGGAVVLLQTGGRLNLAALRPDPSRIDPRTGIGRLLGLDNLVEAGKALAKLAAMGFAAWSVLGGDLHSLAKAALVEPALWPSLILRPALRVAFALIAVQAAVATADLFWVRLRYARSLRMSREEIREELKETEGDPRVKARIKQLRIQRARRRMLAAVPKATVVVTNPTHYAVALAYERATNAAPRVVAKGVDSMAARIREVATANRVPLVANPPLARALYRVEVDTEIPAEYYQAVAEIIAYVWRLGRQAQGNRR